MAGELIIKNGLQVSGSIIADSVTGSFSGSFVGSVTDAVSASYAATASYVNPLTQSVSIRGTGTTDATTALRVENSNGSGSLVVRDNGNVGIGTTALNGLIINGLNSVGLLLQAGNLQGGSGTVQLYAGNNNNSFLRLASEYIREGASGGLGINVVRESITSKFQIKGSGTTSATTSLRVENANASASLVVRDDGRVGIGTTTPSYILDVSGSVRFGGDYKLVYTSTNSGTLLHNGQALEVGSGNTTAQFLGGSIFVFKSNNNIILRGYPSLTNCIFIGGNNNPTETLEVGGSKGTLKVNSHSYLMGNVGIGTTSPSYKLDVSGSGRFSSNVQITGSATNSLLVKGSGTTSATTAFRVEDANASASLVIRDDGQIQARQTTVNNPGYSFEGNTNTGLYMFNGSGTLGTVVNGQYSVLYSATGTSFFSNGVNNISNANLSLRKISNSNLLSIWINASNNFQFEAWQTGVGYDNSIIFQQLGGNVLIGTTTTSSFKLDVSGSGRFTDGLTVTGSLIAPSITGSLFGTSSYATQALSASYAPGGATFPYTGSAEISGSLLVTGATIVQDGAIGIVSTGTTSATTAFEVKNATPEDLFIVKDDGELSINTTKYSSNGVLTNSGGTVTEVVGWTGMININTTPPIMIDVQNGIIVNVT